MSYIVVNDGLSLCTTEVSDDPAVLGISAHCSSGSSGGGMEKYYDGVTKQIFGIIVVRKDCLLLLLVMGTTGIGSNSPGVAQVIQ